MMSEAGLITFGRVLHIIGAVEGGWVAMAQMGFEAELIEVMQPLSDPERGNRATISHGMSFSLAPLIHLS
jgi:hypothetical protein